MNNVYLCYVAIVPVCSCPVFPLGQPSYSFPSSSRFSSSILSFTAYYLHSLLYFSFLLLLTPAAKIPSLRWIQRGGYLLWFAGLWATGLLDPLRRNLKGRPPQRPTRLD